MHVQIQESQSYFLIVNGCTWSNMLWLYVNVLGPETIKSGLSQEKIGKLN